MSLEPSWLEARPACLGEGAAAAAHLVILRVTETTGAEGAELETAGSNGSSGLTSGLGRVLGFQSESWFCGGLCLQARPLTPLFLWADS